MHYLRPAFTALRMRRPSNTNALPLRAEAEMLDNDAYALWANCTAGSLKPAAWVGEAHNRARVRNTNPRPMVTRLKTAIVVAVSLMMCFTF